MKYPWLDGYCLLKPGAEKEYKIDWEAALYKVGGKMFALYGGDARGKPILSLKCDPLFGEMVRRDYRDIIPGYHMNKQHWNSVYLDGEVPDEVMKDMIDRAHNLVLEKLPKKVRENLLQQVMDS